MNQQRLAEIAQAAHLRHNVLIQVPSKADSRVRLCNEQILELVEEIVRLRNELAKAQQDSSDWARLKWWVGSLERQKAHTFQLMHTKGLNFSQALDAVAGEEATWLPPKT